MNFGSLGSLVSSFRSSGPSFVQSIVMRDVASEEQSRKNAMAKAWRAYYGNLGDKPLRVKLGQPDDNIIMNFSRLVVDKGVSFLFGQEVEFHLEDEEQEDGTTESPADKWLCEVWRRNRKQTTLHRLGINGGVTGHAFIKIVMPDGATHPRLIVLDPSTVNVICDPADWERIIEYRIEWNAVSPDNGKPVSYRQLIAQDGAGWLLTDQICDDGKTWRNLREPSLWEYSFPPIFGCQNLPCANDFWGLPDLSDDLLRILHSRNFLASNMSRILRFHAHPKTYAKGMGATKLELSVDDVLFLPNPNAELCNLEMQGDLSGSLGFLRYIDDQLLSLANIPPISLGKIEGTAPTSGVALRLHYQPLLERNGTKQMLYGDMLNALNSALLELGGFGSERQCGTVWRDELPTPVEDAMMWDTLEVASKDTISSKLGFDYATEEPKIKEEKAAAMERNQAAFDAGNVPNAFPSGRANTGNANNGQEGSNSV